MEETVSRMPPFATVDVEVHQGWALEMHEPGPARPQAVDLLFVHGVGGGAWIWPETWLQAFTGAGYRCWTLTLPGRAGGATMGNDPSALDRHFVRLLETRDANAAVESLMQVLPGASLADGPTLADFADAVAAAISRTSRPVVAIGHSLGGAVLQAMLRRGVAPAGTVLLCSVPPYGLWRASAELALTDPVLWIELARMSLYGPGAIDPAVLREGLFPGGISDRDFARLQAQMRDESLAALVQTVGLPPFAPPPGPRSDVLVAGGAWDRLVPPTDLRLSALYYGGMPVVAPKVGHVPMLEAGGAALVPAILDFIAARGGAVAAAA